MKGCWKNNILLVFASILLCLWVSAYNQSSAYAYADFSYRDHYTDYITLLKVQTDPELKKFQDEILDLRQRIHHFKKEQFISLFGNSRNDLIGENFTLAPKGFAIPLGEHRGGALSTSSHIEITMDFYMVSDLGGIFVVYSNNIPTNIYMSLRVNDSFPEFNNKRTFKVRLRWDKLHFKKFMEWIDTRIIELNEKGSWQDN